MKKVLLLLVAFSSIALLTSSCSKDFLDGYEAGSEGYTYIGKYSSLSDCSSACAYNGYRTYRYTYETSNCFCK